MAGKAPGTSTRGGVSTTMGNANGVSSTPSGGKGMGAPFDKGRSGGDSGSNIPTKIYADSIKAPKLPQPSQPSPNGGQGGQQRRGTK